MRHRCAMIPLSQGNPPMNLSPQQAAAISEIESGSGSIVLSAVAGAGKTSTLIEMLAKTQGSVAFCAFNKSIATEIEQKVNKKKIQNVKVGTLHSFGFGAVRRAFSNVKVDGNKLKKIAAEEFTGKYFNLIPFVTQTTAMAKEVGIGACIEDEYNNWFDMIDYYDLDPTIKEDQAIDAAQYLLKCSNNIRNIVDFSDMIYMPIFYKLKMWQHDYVFLDEAQDTNGPRRNLVRMMLKQNGRLVAVGDHRQSIYAFTGANHDSLDLIKKEFGAKELPLSVTFRCPKEVVKVAKQWVPHIESHDSSPDGIVDKCTVADIHKLAKPQDAVICRNTKPLVELAYSLIKNKIPCKVEGRSIGQGLIKLATRWKVTYLSALISKLEVYKEKQIEKNKKKGSQIIEDQVDTLFVFIDQCKLDDTVETLIKKIEELFGDSEGTQQVLTLSTIHKSKGREWDRVFALKMDEYSPSKYAKEDWQIQQENNLLYVQVTRAKYHLTLVE